jgi:hypothetical protein
MDEFERSHGWTLFASVVIGVAGVWNLLLGIAAFTKKAYFSAGSLLYQNLSFWGIVWIFMGALQLLTAFLVLRRSTAGKALGLIGASVSMIVWFFSIGAHPVSSILIIVVDGLVLYALTADRPSGNVPFGGTSDGPQSTRLEPSRRFG